MQVYIYDFVCLCVYVLAAGSVLLQDEASYGGDVAIDMDAMSGNTYQQQITVAQDQVCLCHLQELNNSEFNVKRWHSCLCPFSTELSSSVGDFVLMTKK